MFSKCLTFLQKDLYFAVILNNKLISKIPRCLILLCSTLRIPLFVAYIRWTEIAVTEFMLVVLSTTPGEMLFLLKCGANNWIMIFVALKSFLFMSQTISLSHGLLLVFLSSLSANLLIWLRDNRITFHISFLIWLFPILWAFSFHTLLC